MRDAPCVATRLTSPAPSLKREVTATERLSGDNDEARREEGRAGRFGIALLILLRETDLVPNQ